VRSVGPCFRVAVQRGPRRSVRRLAVVSALAVGLLALVVGSASAALVHPFERQITEAGGTPLVQPFGLAVEGSGNLWLADQSRAVVDKYDPAGTFLTESSGEGRFVRPEGAAFSDAAGHLYVGDIGLHTVLVLNSDGSFDSEISSFPGGGVNPGTFALLGVAVDNSTGPNGGDLYISLDDESGDDGVTRVDDSGAPVDFTAGPDEGTNTLTGPFSEPDGVAVGPDGEIFVIVRGFAHTAYEFEPSGALIRELTLPSGPRAIAVDPTSGNLLVAIAENSSDGEPNQILELDHSGTIVGRITEADGSHFGGEIRGLAVAPDGTLYGSVPASHLVDVFGPLTNLPIESDGGSVTDVSATAATLHGQVNPQGHPTAYSFQYGTVSCTLQPAACTEAPSPLLAIGSGEASIEVSQPLTGLQPDTTYFYRLIVEDTGTGEQIFGPDRTFTTQGAVPTLLPDNRAWELVSPPDKGGAVLSITGEVGIIQAAAAGGAIAYLANAPTEAGARGNAGPNQVLSTRGASGWSSRDLATPHQAPTGETPSTSPEYKAFSEELAGALVQPFGRFNPTLSAEASEQTPYLRTLGACALSCYQPLLTAKAGFENAPAGFGEEASCVEGGATSGAATVCGPAVEAATPDLGHAVLRSAAPLTIGAPPGTVVPGLGVNGVTGSLYEWGAGHLQLISVLPPAAPGEPELPAPVGDQDQLALGHRTGSLSHAISTDGRRVFWESLGDLYMRDTVAEESLQLDVAEPTCPVGACESGGGEFQVASADGSRVFFSDPRRLTSDSGASENKPDLYECRIVGMACELTDLTPLAGGESANVQGLVLGAGQDGSSIYFVADGTLGGVSGAEPGTCTGEASKADATCNLYLHRSGRPTRLVAVLSGADAKIFPARPGYLTSRPVRVSSNGEWLAFLSQGSLTGYDNRDAVSGRPDAEAYVYDAATGRLACASCDPTGARPVGVEYGRLEGRASEVLPAVSNEWESRGSVAALLPRPGSSAKDLPGHQPRYLSNSGRLYFNGLDALEPQDTNQVGDVYQYEPSGVGSCGPTSGTFHPVSAGCVDLISSGTSTEYSAFLDASESGDDIFFLTGSRLTSGDVDSRRDVYDAHVCSGGSPCFPEPSPAAEPCKGEACQQPAAPPAEATPGSTASGAKGNVVQCRKGQVKKGGRCVKKQQKKAKKHKKKHHKKSKNKAKQKKKANSQNSRANANSRRSHDA
jgi:hypothetical protein